MFKPVKLTLLGILAVITTASAVLINSPKIQACGNTTYGHPSLDGNRTAYGGVWSSQELMVAAKNRNLRGQRITYDEQTAIEPYKFELQTFPLVRTLTYPWPHLAS